MFSRGTVRIKVTTGLFPGNKAQLGGCKKFTCKGDPSKVCRRAQCSTNLQSWVCSSHVREKARERRNGETEGMQLCAFFVHITTLLDELALIGNIRFYLKPFELVIGRIPGWLELNREFRVVHQSKSNSLNWFSVQVWFDSLATGVAHKIEQWALIGMLESSVELTNIQHSELLKKAWIRSLVIWKNGLFFKLHIIALLQGCLPCGLFHVLSS